MAIYVGTKRFEKAKDIKGVAGAERIRRKLTGKEIKESDVKKSTSKKKPSKLDIKVQEFVKTGSADVSNLSRDEREIGLKIASVKRLEKKVEDIQESRSNQIKRIQTQEELLRSVEGKTQEQAQAIITREAQKRGEAEGTPLSVRFSNYVVRKELESQAIKTGFRKEFLGVQPQERVYAQDYKPFYLEKPSKYNKVVVGTPDRSYIFTETPPQEIRGRIEAAKPPSNIFTATEQKAEKLQMEAIRERQDNYTKSLSKNIFGGLGGEVAAAGSGALDFVSDPIKVGTAVAIGTTMAFLPVGVATTAILGGGVAVALSSELKQIGEGKRIGRSGGEAAAFVGIAGITTQGITSFKSIFAKPKIIGEEAITKRITQEDLIRDVTTTTTTVKQGKKTYEIFGRSEQEIIKLPEGKFKISGRGGAGDTIFETRGIGKEIDNKIFEAETLTKLEGLKGKPKFRIDIGTTRELQNEPFQVLETLTRGGTQSSRKIISIDNLKPDIVSGSKTTELLRKEILSESGKVIATEQILATRRGGTTSKAISDIVAIEQPKVQGRIQLITETSQPIKFQTENLFIAARQQAYTPTQTGFKPIVTSLNMLSTPKSIGVSKTSKVFQSQEYKGDTKVFQIPQLKQYQQQDNLFKLGSSFSYNIDSQIKPISDLKINQLQIPKVQVKPISKAATESINQSKLESVQIQKIDTINYTPTQQIITPTPPITPPPFIPPTIPLGIDDYRTTQIQKGYNVFVKSKGKYKKVNSKVLTENNALSLGADLTDNSTARTFNIVPTNTNPKPQPTNNYYIMNSYKYRKLKGSANKNPYTEKSTYAIDSPNEIRGITLEGLMAIRRKRQKINTIF